jgi:hypothetical protein
MSVPQSVADILNHPVTFQPECIDRMYLNGSVWQLAVKRSPFIHQTIYQLRS